jgi:hypothetical protein
MEAKGDLNMLCDAYEQLEGQCAKKCRWPLETGKSKGTDYLLGSPERA